MSIRHTDQSIENHVQQSLGTKEGCGARKGKEGREGRGEGCRGAGGGGAARNVRLINGQRLIKASYPTPVVFFGIRTVHALPRAVLKSNVQRLLKTREGRVVNVQRLLKSRDGRTISGQRLLKVSLAPSLHNLSLNYYFKKISLNLPSVLRTRLSTHLKRVSDLCVQPCFVNLMVMWGVPCRSGSCVLSLRLKKNKD